MEKSPLPTDPLGREFADFLRRYDNDRTRRTYRHALNAFHAFKTTRKSEQRGRPSPTLSIVDLDVGDLDGFHDHLLAQDKSKPTIQVYVAAASRFLEYMLAEGRVSEKFSLERAKAKARLARQRLPYPIPKFDPELPQLILHWDRLDLPAPDSNRNKRERLIILRNRALFHTLYATAARESEVAGMQRKTIADGRQREFIVKGKGGKERPAWLDADAQHALRQYLATRHDSFESVFISIGRRYGDSLTPASIRRIVAETGKQYGIDASPHDFRHYRASQMLNEGAPLEAIQEILGHSDIGTTRKVYAHFSRKRAREIFDQTFVRAQDALEQEH